MSVLVLVFGAAILLTWMLVHSYSGRDGAPARRAAPRAHARRCGVDGGGMFGSDASASDCGPGDGGAGCGGDGGGGGGGGD